MNASVETSNWPLPANGLRFIVPPRPRRLGAAAQRLIAHRRRRFCAEAPHGTAAVFLL